MLMKFNKDGVKSRGVIKVCRLVNDLLHHSKTFSLRSIVKIKECLKYHKSFNQPSDFDRIMCYMKTRTIESY